MAIRFYDGFELYAADADVAKKVGVLASPGFAAFQTGRLGVGKSMYRAGGYAIAPFASAVANLSVGAAYKVEILAQGGSPFDFRNSGSAICDLVVTSTGALQARRNGTQIGITSAGLIAINTWYYLETEFVRDGSAGSFKVWCNGVQVLDITGANTGASDINEIRFGTSGTNVSLDDLYVTDAATKLGEVRIDALAPTADTATKGWTASSGADNYAMVDEQPFSTTDYVTGSTGDKDYYDFADLSFDPASIFAVQVTTLAKKDDATARTFRGNIKSSSSEGNGATRGLGTSYVMYPDIFETDPNGGGAWTQASVNAAQVGIEVVS